MSDTNRIVWRFVWWPTALPNLNGESERRFLKFAQIKQTMKNYFYRPPCPNQFGELPCWIDYWENESWAN